MDTSVLIFLILVGIFIFLLFIRKSVKNKNNIQRTSSEKSSQAKSQRSAATSTPKIDYIKAASIDDQTISHKETSTSTRRSIWKADEGKEDMIEFLGKLAASREPTPAAEREQKERIRLQRLAEERRELSAVEARWDIRFYAADDPQAPTLSYPISDGVAQNIWEGINRVSGRRMTGTVPRIAGEQLAIVSVLRYIAEHEGPIQVSKKEETKHTLNDAKIYLDRGYVLQQKGKLDDAIVQYQTAIKIAPDYAEAHNNLATVLANLNRHDEAITILKNALRINPEFAQAHFNLGFYLFEKGRYKEATEHLKKTLQIDPNQSDAYLQLGRALAEQELYADAIIAYQNAIRIDPHFASSHTYLGIALYKLGKLDEAVLSFQEALRLDPNFVEAHLYSGMIFFSQKNTKKQISTLNDSWS